MLTMTTMQPSIEPSKAKIDVWIEAGVYKARAPRLEYAFPDGNLDHL